MDLDTCAMSTSRVHSHTGMQIFCVVQIVMVVVWVVVQGAKRCCTENGEGNIRKSTLSLEVEVVERKNVKKIIKKMETALLR